MERKITTENSIDIFYYPNRHTHSFCLSLYAKAGCIYESGRDNGITHFLEHMIFRGINHNMGGEMYRKLDELGLYFNGATYKEFMQLYIVGAPKHFEEAAEILLKVFQPFAMTAAEVVLEQQRVKAEIREAEDMKSLDYFAGTFAWEGTPVKNTILGTKGNVSNFSRRRMESCRKEVFSAENIFFYVTGNVSEEDIKFLAEKTAGFRAAKAERIRDNCVPVPESFGKRLPKVHIKNSTYSMVQFSFDFVSEKYTGAELALLYDILFSGENSLIHQELSEKRGWIYSYSSALEKYTNIGRIYFSYEIGKKDMTASVSQVLASLSELLDEGGLSQRLACVLPEYVDNAYMVYDDNEGFNWQRAYECHIMGNHCASIEAGRAAFEAVTETRLLEIIKEIFRGENLVLSLKGNKNKIDAAEIEAILTRYSAGENRRKKQEKEDDL